MNIHDRKKIVLLGMMTCMPVAGVVWQNIHYLLGLRRLGYDVYYVEAHRRTPRRLMLTPDDDGTALGCSFIDKVMRRFDLGDRWCFHAADANGEGPCHGLSLTQLRELYRSAHLIINLHGGTVPRPELIETNRLVFLETDPVNLQIKLHEGAAGVADFLVPHCAFFSFGENFGAADCRVPHSERFKFLPTRQPVVMDLWERESGPGEAFTTVGNWQQPKRVFTFGGETYHWSKHYEFLKFIDLPRRRDGQPFELALSSYTAEDRAMLESHGWRVRDGMSISTEPEPYRDYIRRSRGEFTVAKDQNVRLRSGWFSDRSATYLAAGRPVVTQDTGFCNIFPTGAGLFSFSTMEDILRAVDAITGDYEKHRRAAEEIARTYFDSDVVLRSLLERVGV